MSGSPTIEQLHAMLRIRRFEERCVQLYSETRIRGFLHLYIGEEAVAVGAMQAIGADDPVVSTYREHGHALARGVPMRTVMAEMFGKVTGCSRGRGGSMHLFDVSRGFYGGNAIVAGGLPLAVGLGLAARMRDENRVTLCLFGDGAVAEGEFHECLNLAALWRLPVLFLCENNRYAMGTAIELANANPDVALRAASYGMPAWSVDGMDVAAVQESAVAAAATVRAAGFPCLLEARTYRFRAHSMYDPELYRDKAEVEAWKARDPLLTAEAALRTAGLLGDDVLAAMEQAVADEIEDAVSFAEGSPVEDVADLLRFVMTEPVADPDPAVTA